jgi:hypothetical protein
MGAIFSLVSGWALKLAGGAIGESAVAFLTPFLSAGASVAGFVVNFAVGILLDLSKTYEGRIFLAVVFLGLAGWYVQHNYTYVARAYLAAVEQDIDKLTTANAALSKRPASCPKQKRR